MNGKYKCKERTFLIVFNGTKCRIFLTPYNLHEFLYLVLQSLMETYLKNAKAKISPEYFMKVLCGESEAVWNIVVTE
jgi:hypothetical protein